jgi:hypothetical protein
MADILQPGPNLNILQAPQKIVTFTGAENFGGYVDASPIHVWTPTGTVIVLNAFGNVTTGLVSAGAATLALETPTNSGTLWVSQAYTNLALHAQIVNGIVLTVPGSVGATTAWTALNESIQFRAGVAAITAGVIAMDAWYIPVTAGASLSLAFAGVAQVETATVVETIPGTLTAGNATFTVTAAGMAGSPVAVTVAVALNDSATQVAVKARAALALNANTGAWFTWGGTGADVVGTVQAIAANDSTMNIAIAGTLGLTAEPTSTLTKNGEPTV